MQIPEVVLLRRGSEVAVLVHVAFEQTVYGGHHAKRSDVELSSVDEQGPVYVLLHDPCPPACRNPLWQVVPLIVITFALQKLDPVIRFRRRWLL